MSLARSCRICWRCVTRCTRTSFACSSSRSPTADRWPTKSTVQRTCTWVAHISQLTTTWYRLAKLVFYSIRPNKNLQIQLSPLVDFLHHLSFGTGCWLDCCRWWCFRGNYFYYYCSNIIQIAIQVVCIETVGTGRSWLDSERATAAAVQYVCNVHRRTECLVSLGSGSRCER